MKKWVPVALALLMQCFSFVRSHGLRGHEQETDHRDLIIGGQSAKNGDYPYFVHFQPPGCGGTLIAPDIVLTAGHVSAKRDDIYFVESHSNLCYHVQLY